MHLSFSLLVTVAASAHAFRPRCPVQSRNIFSTRLLSAANNNEPISVQNQQISSVLHSQAALATAMISVLNLVPSARAADFVATKQPTETPAEDAPKPIITDMVYMDVKIANYTEESTGANKGAFGSGRVIIGLFGKIAPESVKRFLSCIDGNGVDYPSYINSQFTRVVGGDYLEMEKVRGVNKVSIAGTEQYEYGGNVLTDYQPILENNDLRHTRAGLLTRRQLTEGPEFGITLDKAPELDSFHVVFGTVLEGMSVIDAISEIPTYSYKTKTGYGGKERGVENGIADQWFEAQRNFYVKAGKAFGDERAVDQRGRLLRRVTVKNAGRVLVKDSNVGSPDVF
jgi:cyclophilin family peptidyl-prolyl cis-trans isomerase